MTKTDDLGDVELTLVDSVEECEAFLRWLGERHVGPMSVDIETGGLEFWKQPIRLFQMGDSQHGWAIPWERWAGLAYEALKRWDGEMVAHNAPFEGSFLEKEGALDPREFARFEDTMLKAHLVNPLRPIGLKSVAGRLVSPAARAAGNELDDVFRRTGLSWDTVPYDLDAYWMYGALDPVLTSRLDVKLDALMDEDEKRAYERELAAVWPLLKARQRGCRIDLDIVVERRQEFVDRIYELREESRSHGVENPASNHQVVAALQEDGIELHALTPTGDYSLEGDVLEAIDHPLAPLVLELRDLTKTVSTYFDNITEMVDGDILHPGIKSVGAKTGRMSIVKPSLQNLPRTATVRDAFIAREGHRLILSDWRGMEMRVFACFAQERSMIDAINRGEDLHDFTATNLFGSEFTKIQRAIAKGANFAKIYVAGTATFSASAGITQSYGEEIIAAYDERFPRVGQFQRALQQKALDRYHDEGAAYVRSPYGRRHRVESPSETYKLVNYLVQGSCADILKKKIIELDNAGLGDWFILPVHDEIVLDVPEEHVEEAVRVTREVMTERHDFEVPLEVDIDVVERWGAKYN